jgi:hypothetical protein
MQRVKQQRRKFLNMLERCKRLLHGGKKQKREKNEGRRRKIKEGGRGAPQAGRA